MPRILFVLALAFPWGLATSVGAQPMGATPVEGGVSFRVWAPHATAVHVRGTFNNWQLDNPLNIDVPSGVWSGVVPGARAGQSYKYFVTNSSPTSPNGTTAWRRDPYTRVTDPFSEIDSNSVVHDPSTFDWGAGADFQPPPLQRLVIYEMHIGSYNAPLGTPGAFSDSIERLDSLAALGVNAVELLPLHETPGVNDWGYNCTLVAAIEQEFGGPNGFKAFVKACHERGIAVIADVVFNHALRDGNDMWEFDLWSTGDGGGIWFFNDAQHRDSPFGPRYDYTRPEVVDLILDTLRLYVNEFRVDGFRFDATGTMRVGNAGAIPGAVEVLRTATTTLREEFPGVILIAEDYQADKLATLPVASGGLGFDAEWSEFPFDTVRILSDVDGVRDVNAVAELLEETYHGGAFERVVFIESHDTAATEDPPFQSFPYRGAYLPARLNRIDPETNVATFRLSMMGVFLMFTSPGVPMLFMGQEAYATSTFEYPSPPALDWQHLDTAHPGIIQLHRDLIALRLNTGLTTRGLSGAGLDIHHRNNAGQVIGWIRSDGGGPGDDTVMLLNLSGTDFNQGYHIGVPRAGMWHVRFHGDLTTYHNDFTTPPDVATQYETQPTPQDGQPCRVTVPRLPPLTGLILSQDPVPDGMIVR